MNTRPVTDLRPVPRRKRNEVRISTSIRISQRIYMYAKERYNIPLTIEETFRAYLQKDGVDITVPHENEVLGTLEGGKPLTFRDGKAMGLYDIRGNFIEESGIAESDRTTAVPGAVL